MRIFLNLEGIFWGIIYKNFSFVEGIFLTLNISELVLMGKKLIKRDAYVNQLKEYVNSDFVKVYIGIRRLGQNHFNE